MFLIIVDRVFLRSPARKPGCSCDARCGGLGLTFGGKFGIILRWRFAAQLRRGIYRYL